MTFLAKSASQGGLTLFDHTRHVLIAIEALAEGFGFSAEERRVARLGAVLHDLGKAHPHFQKMVKEGLDEIDRLDDDPPHRHELSSLLLLPVFQKSDWPALVDLVVSHHKSVREDTRNRGLLDIAERTHGPDRAFDRFAQAWEDWANPVLKEVAEPLLNEPLPSISLEKARHAFDFAVNHCTTREVGWSRLKGLLMSADHLASHFMENTAARVQALFRVPDFGAFDRPNALFPLSGRDANDVRPHTLVLAPTGAGKTDYLLRRCRGRVFYTLPFQASINAMHDRITKVLGDEADIRRVHAASRITFDMGQREDVELQRHPGAGVKVLTPHQLAAIAFGTHGHEATALDVAGCDVILDEVHVYSGFIQAMVVAIVEALLRLGCRIHIGSATIPAALRSRLLELLGGEDTTLLVELSPEELRTFNRHVVHKATAEEEIQVLKEAIESGERILVVRNRVDRAQCFYEDAREQWPMLPVLLVHSRFRRGDRAILEREIGRFNELPGPCLVVSTQVVEVSLDISFDRMLTEAAPIDSLVQRFGRVNRRRPAPGLRPVHVLSPPTLKTDAKPYDLDVIKASFDVLPCGDVLQEETLQNRINSVYPGIELQAISGHLLHDGESYRLYELQHRPKQFFLERLDIDALTCIREADAAAYQGGRGGDRMQLEIPVPLSALIGRIRGGELDQLRAGSFPYKVPDAWYDEKLGLSIPKDKSTATYAAAII